MPEHVVLRFKWLCVEVDLDVDDKDKVNMWSYVLKLARNAVLAN